MLRSTSRAPGCLLVVSGPSGVGKSTVVEALTALRGDATVAVSATTRPPRPGEVDGVHYHFVDGATFDDMVVAGAFLEWAEYDGQRYGTPWSSVREPLADGGVVVLEIEVQGARQVRERFPDAVLVFLHPPSERSLAARVRGRASDDDDAIARRLEIGAAERAQAGMFDYQVTNARVHTAVAEIARIVERHCGRSGATRSHLLGAEQPSPRSTT